MRAHNLFSKLPRVGLHVGIALPGGSGKAPLPGIENYVEST